MKKNQSNDDYIKLRSEKVRNIIGKMPQSLVWWSVTIITTMLIALSIIALCIKYPYGNGETILQHIVKSARFQNLFP